MNLVDIWTEKTREMFSYVELGKQALGKLGYVEDNEFDDHGGNTVVLRGDDKKFNTTGAFFVGVYLHTTKTKELSESALHHVLTIFDCFFWAGNDTVVIKDDIDQNNFWEEENFEGEEAVSRYVLRNPTDRRPNWDEILDPYGGKVTILSGYHTRMVLIETDEITFQQIKARLNRIICAPEKEYEINTG